MATRAAENTLTGLLAAAEGGPPDATALVYEGAELTFAELDDAPGASRDSSAAGSARC
jgi:non-ribosomal peptide synthetase component F